MEPATGGKREDAKIWAARSPGARERGARAGRRPAGGGASKRDRVPTPWRTRSLVSQTLPLNLLPNRQTHKNITWGLSLTPSAQIFLPSQSSGPPIAALLNYQSPDNSE